MNPKTLELRNRTKRFALDVLAFVRTLPATDEAKDIGRQLCAVRHECRRQLPGRLPWTLAIFAQSTLTATENGARVK